MTKKIINNIKLGSFVIAGLLFLVVLLYFIGANRDLFGSTFVLKTRFENVQGLVPGNNVRFAGIEAGTVKRVQMLNDTLIEVTMIIRTKMKGYIRTNAIATISTDGLVGNRLVAIVPSKDAAPPVAEGDILASRRVFNTDEMMETLFHTNNDVAQIAGGLKETVQRINTSTSLWRILNDESLPGNLKQSLVNVRSASVRVNDMVSDLQLVISDLQEGKGLLGAVLTDTAMVNDLGSAVAAIRQAGHHAESMTADLDKMIGSIRLQVDSGKGTINALLKDTALVVSLNNSLENIEKGTHAFNENMEALKHNFLFRRYFRKQERQRQKEEKKNTATLR